MQLKRILVAVKPWERGLPLAAHHARQLARQANAQIELVGTVFDAAVAARRERGDSAARATQDRAVAVALVELDRLASSMCDASVRLTTRVVWGVPAYEGIVRAAETWAADLLVIGTHEVGTSHARLTDTDWQLMRRVPCPLLLVKTPTFAGYRTILIAADPPRTHDESGRLDDVVLEAGRGFARLFGSTVVEGGAAEAAIDLVAARRADLVVVGAPRTPGAVTEAVGRTAEMVAAGVSCDVLVVPAAPSEIG